MKNKKHIIFDWDGTLADTLHIWTAADTLLIESLGKKPRDTVGKDRKDFLHRSTSKKPYTEYNKYLMESYGFIGVTPEEVGKMRKDILRGILKTADLKEGAEEILLYLESLGKTLSLATVTTKWDIEFYKAYNEQVNTKTRGFQIFNGALLTSNDVNNQKPNPEVYLKALELTGFNKEESLIIEDSLTGVMAAKNAGIQVISIYDEENEEDMEQISSLVDYQAKDFNELIKIFR